MLQASSRRCRLSQFNRGTLVWPQDFGILESLALANEKATVLVILALGKLKFHVYSKFEASLCQCQGD